MISNIKMQKEREEEKELDEEENEVEAMDGPTSVDSLTQKGVSAADIKKLVEAGFNTIESILFVPKKDLIQV